MRKSLLILVLLVLVASVLIIGNPTQSHFLKAVSDDYGSYHPGMDLSPKQLNNIGTSNYHSYWLFSSYEYQFGNISINYFGFAFMTFYRGTATKDQSRDSRIIQS